MNKLFLKNEKTDDWQQEQEHGELRWKLLIDSTIIKSSSVSVGLLKIKPMVELPLHYHRPNEVYIIKRGKGLLLELNTTKHLTTGDIIFIPKNTAHGLKNTGSTPMLLYWIFPTDSWEEVKYNFLPQKGNH